MPLNAMMHAILRFKFCFIFFVVVVVVVQRLLFVSLFPLDRYTLSLFIFRSFKKTSSFFYPLSHRYFHTNVNTFRSPIKWKEILFYWMNCALNHMCLQTDKRCVFFSLAYSRTTIGHWKSTVLFLSRSTDETRSWFYFFVLIIYLWPREFKNELIWENLLWFLFAI